MSKVFASYQPSETRQSHCGNKETSRYLDRQTKLNAHHITICTQIIRDQTKQIRSSATSRFALKVNADANIRVWNPTLSFKIKQSNT